jgi:hypothetical protein
VPDADVPVAQMISSMVDAAGKVLIDGVSRFPQTSLTIKS